MEGHRLRRPRQSSNVADDAVKCKRNWGQPKGGWEGISEETGENPCPTQVVAGIRQLTPPLQASLGVCEQRRNFSWLFFYCTFQQNDWWLLWQKWEEFEGSAYCRAFARFCARLFYAAVLGSWWLESCNMMPKDYSDVPWGLCHFLFFLFGILFLAATYHSRWTELQLWYRTSFHFFIGFYRTVAHLCGAMMDIVCSFSKHK